MEKDGRDQHDFLVRTRARRLPLLAGVAALVVLGLTLITCAPATTGAAGDPDNGKYIFQANGGCGCHGPSLAGYRADGPPELPDSAPFGEIFEGPFGSVPASNVTPDKATGLGDWTDDQIVRAIREGVGKDDQFLYPIMPDLSFHFMSDADVKDLVAYLRTVTPVSNQVPERTLDGPVPTPPDLPPAPATAPTDGLERGRYLVTAVSICGECHTPQTQEGGRDMGMFLAGGLVPRAGGNFEIAPNITPDTATGIGKWTEEQIVTLLKTGARPSGKKVGGLMRQQVAGGYDRLTDVDAQAIATYLKSIPPVLNLPGPPPRTPEGGPGDQFGPGRR